VEIPFAYWFSIARTNQKAFIDGDNQTKKEILIALGSNPILGNKKFSILANNWFVRIEEGRPELEQEMKRLEPIVFPLDKNKNEAFLRLRSVMRGVVNGIITWFQSLNKYYYVPKIGQNSH